MVHLFYRFESSVLRPGVLFQFKFFCVFCEYAPTAGSGLAMRYFMVLHDILGMGAILWVGVVFNG